MTVRTGSQRMQFPYFDVMIVDGLVVDDFLKVAAEGILTKNPNNQGSFSGGEGLGRPLHKLGKIEKESGLDLVFSDSCFLTTRRIQAKPACPRQTEQQENKDPQARGWHLRVPVGTGHALCVSQLNGAVVTLLFYCRNLNCSSTAG